MQPLIEDFLDDVDARLSRGTYEVRQQGLRRYDAYLEEEGIAVEEATSKDLHRFFIKENRKYASETVKKRYDTVKLLYDFLQGPWETIEEHPMENLERSTYASGSGTDKKRSSSKVYVTQEEMEEMAANTPSPKLRNSLMIRLLFVTGVRRGELVNIELDDITRYPNGGGKINVYASKTNEWREVYFDNSLDFLFSQWLDGGYREAKTVESSYLFPTNRSEKMNPQRVNKIVRKAAENAGLQEEMTIDARGRSRAKITAHALRHGHAIHAIQSGIDVRSVAMHMGHSDISTTMEYLQIASEDCEKAYQAFEA